MLFGAFDNKTYRMSVFLQCAKIEMHLQKMGFPLGNNSAWEEMSEDCGITAVIAPEAVWLCGWVVCFWSPHANESELMTHCDHVPGC